jgi:hypothetical protein
MLAFIFQVLKRLGTFLSFNMKIVESKTGIKSKSSSKINLRRTLTFRWPTRIRTWNKGTKNLCVTVTPSANSEMLVQKYDLKVFLSSIIQKKNSYYLLVISYQAFNSKNYFKSKFQIA